MSILGYCPICGEDGMSRERRPGGDDTCRKGHTYPTHQRFTKPPLQDQLDAHSLGGFTRPAAQIATRAGALVYCVSTHAQAEALTPLVTAFPQPDNDGVRVIPFGASALAYCGRDAVLFRGLVVIRPQEGGVHPEAYAKWVHGAIEPFLAPGAPKVIL